MKIYEYIFAAVTMVAILVSAIFLTGISPQLYRSISEVEQLKVTSQKIMVQLLLSPGEPRDWGEDIAVRPENLSSFGLATSAAFTGDAFVLDLDKVQRLSREIPSQLRIPPSRVMELLNLGLDYGIKLEFNPALYIDVLLEGSDATIRVLLERGAPASCVNIVVGAFCAQGGKIKSSVVMVSDFDGDGICHATFPFNPELLIVVADHYGVQMVRVHLNSSSAYIGHLIGRFLLTGSSLTPANGSALQVFTLRSPNGTLALMNVTCSLNRYDHVSISGYNVYDMEYSEQNVVAVIALAEDDRLIVAYRVVPSTYSSAAGEVSPPLSYMLERSVRVGPSAYTLRLIIWRTWY